MLRRTLSGLAAAAVLTLGLVSLGGIAEAKTGCPKSGPSAGNGNQYPPGQCKAKTNRSTVEQGGQVEVSGDGYDKNENVQAEMHSVTIQLGTLTATVKGVAAKTLTIPLNAPLGDHTISLYGLTSGRYLTADIRVVPAGLPRTSNGGTGAGSSSGGGSNTIGGLPRTGVMVAGLGAAGLGAVALGTGLVAAGRRRRQAVGA